MAKSKKQNKTVPGKKRKRNRKKKPLIISFWYAGGIIFLAGCLIAWPYIRHGKVTETGAKVPSEGYCYGIDISSYQREIQWDSVKVMTDTKKRTTSSKLHAKDIKPISFVFIKASEGASMKDKKFTEHWSEAGRHGIRRGAYHFFRSSKDPVRQAENFIRAVGVIRETDLPPVLDIETIHKGCSIEELNDKALIWLEIIEDHYDRKPIVYSSAYFIRDILSDNITGHYPIWVAHYEKEEPDCRKWDIWQFTDKAVIFGIEGKVDLNATRVEILDSL